MIATREGTINTLPKELYHDPSLKNKYGRTVAMCAAVENRIHILPK